MRLPRVVVARGRVMRRRWGHDGDVAGARVGARALEHLASGQVGKVQVEHDDVGSVLVGQLDRGTALHGGRREMPGRRRSFAWTSAG